MKKKIYFPDKISIVVFCSFLIGIALLFLGESIKVLVVMFSQLKVAKLGDTLIRMLISLLFIIPCIFIYIKISQYMCFKVILDNSKMSIKDDKYTKNKKIQYETFVEFNDIENIDVFWSNKKSNGEASHYSSITGGRSKIPYLRITTKNGEQKLFLIMFTSKKTLIKLVNEIKLRLKISGNQIEFNSTDNILKTIK